MLIFCDNSIYLLKCVTFIFTLHEKQAFQNHEQHGNDSLQFAQTVTNNMPKQTALTTGLGRIKFSSKNQKNTA